ncbi:replication initiator protein [Dipodfec virus UOA04_Rod_754]|nr:replication initiator protein [Dipodfec virus UOA04_Rod_754]
MCLFPIPNMDIDGSAYRSGVHSFDCGACPECLSKRSSAWALRAVAESKLHAYNCMVTLTYDHFKRDEHGEFVLDARGRKIENSVDPNLKVCKRDVQLFVKRLRKKFGSGIKYIICSEYGSRTHRAHYHCIFFGVRFYDAVFYKKSKRGNPIYMSNTLTTLWNHGICTIDCINIGSASARYCTKYCAKQRSDDTFMLFSQNIGIDYLLSEFNGKSYFVEGREHPIPRAVWQKYIVNKYSGFPIVFSPRYVNRTPLSDADGSYAAFSRFREMYRFIRDSDCVYRDYIEYWRRKSAQFESIRLPIINRIYLLNNDKFAKYKSAALRYYSDLMRDCVVTLAPGSNSGKGFLARRLEESCLKMHVSRCAFHLPFLSRPNTASDTAHCTFDFDLQKNIENFNKNLKKYLTNEKFCDKIKLSNEVIDYGLFDFRGES